MSVERTGCTFPVPAGSSYWFTVFTPTYNRAHLLHRAFESLRQQTCRSFEWIIVDDGSADNTEAVVKELQAGSNFPIAYVRQSNKGKHVAINRAVRQAAGYFIAILDDDDALTPDTLEKCLQLWELIPSEDRNRFVGVTGFCADLEGNIIGNPLPCDFVDSDGLSMQKNYGSGDKWGVQRIDVMRRFQFPEDAGFIADSLLWNRISQEYLQRFHNEVFALVDRRSDGSTAHSMQRRVRSPHLSTLYYREYVSYRQLSLRMRLRGYANYVRFSQHARIPLLQQAREAPSGLLWCCCLPLGTALCMRDRWLMRQRARE